MFLLDEEILIQKNVKMLHPGLKRGVPCPVPLMIYNDTVKLRLSHYDWKDLKSELHTVSQHSPLLSFDWAAKIDQLLLRIWGGGMMLHNAESLSGKPMRGTTGIIGMIRGFNIGVCRGINVSRVNKHEVEETDGCVGLFKIKVLFQCPSKGNISCF